MDFHGIDIATLGTFLGGAASGLLTRFLGIHRRMTALEARIELQAENHANLTSELMLTREALAKAQKELEGVKKLALRERRLKRALARRVTELERELALSKGREASLAKEMAELRVDLGPSHRTMPPPGAKGSR